MFFLEGSSKVGHFWCCMIYCPTVKAKKITPESDISVHLKEEKKIQNNQEICNNLYFYPDKDLGRKVISTGLLNTKF